MRDFTKSEIKKLRSLASKAYRRELQGKLRDLDSKFEDWRNEVVDEFALAESIHEFHVGPARGLYSLYERMDAGHVVARAVGRGILDEAEVPDKILENLKGLVDFAREHAHEPNYGV